MRKHLAWWHSALSCFFSAADSGKSRLAGLRPEQRLLHTGIITTTRLHGTDKNRAVDCFIIIIIMKSRSCSVKAGHYADVFCSAVPSCSSLREQIMVRIHLFFQLFLTTILSRASGLPVSPDCAKSTNTT